MAKHSHTGPIHHSDMVHRLGGHGKKDKHASKEYHAANAEHGMHMGLTHDNEGHEGSDRGNMGGAPSESENCEYS